MAQREQESEGVGKVEAGGAPQLQHRIETIGDLLGETEAHRELMMKLTQLRSSAELCKNAELHYIATQLIMLYLRVCATKLSTLRGVQVIANSEQVRQP